MKVFFGIKPTYSELWVHYLVLAYAFSFGFQVEAREQRPDYLSQWAKKPRISSWSTPKKQTTVIPSIGTPIEIQNVPQLSSKMAFRDSLCRQSGSTNCEGNQHTWAYSNDFSYLESFIGAYPEVNIDRLDSFKYGAAFNSPWSGSYWPDHKGGIGVRYADPNFPDSSKFEKNYAYFQSQYLRPARQIENLNTLSPAEKYDLLFDDPNWTLTKSVWAAPLRTFQATGHVETWTGICHGWSPAAMNHLEPRRSVDFYLPHLQRTMTFYPDDIKALGSQLWATTNPTTYFIGGRCNVKNPQTDQYGRIIDPDCFDINPSIWHLALLNRMGIHQLSFVYDATYDYEVWNQPLSSYHLNYFNPSTLNRVSTLNEAVVPYQQFQNDRFRSYRNPNVAAVIGVELTLYYVTENHPTANTGLMEPDSRLVEVTYYYDLELDVNRNVIGGEWYQAPHPDMMWRPALPKTLAHQERIDNYWDGILPIPVELQNLMKPAAHSSQPLSSIIQALFWFSKF
jgi:hypothetical protein